MEEFIAQGHVVYEKVGRRRLIDEGTPDLRPVVRREKNVVPTRSSGHGDVSDGRYHTFHAEYRSGRFYERDRVHGICAAQQPHDTAAELQRRVEFDRRKGAFVRALRAIADSKR
jgi:hypothetical protein